MLKAALQTVFILYRQQRATFFGGANSSAVPEKLKTLANSGKTVELNFDLSTVEPVERKNESEPTKPFYLFSVKIKPGNNYESFTPTVTFGTLAAAILNGGKTSCIVKADETENKRTGKQVTYFNIEATAPPTITAQLVDDVEKLLANLKPEETEDVEELEPELDDVQ